MEMATYLVAAVMVEGQSVRKVAQEHGVSKTWLYELVARYQAEGEAGLVSRSLAAPVAEQGRRSL